MRATAETAIDCLVVGFATSLSLGLDTTRLGDPTLRIDVETHGQARGTFHYARGPKS